MMHDCLFCNIAERKIPANILYEDNDILAFHDIDPKAPTHILIIPKQHIATLNALTQKEAALSGKLILTAPLLASQLGCAETGYRLIMNCNQDGGQQVYHLHLHLLGGRSLCWPPG